MKNYRYILFVIIASCFVLTVSNALFMLHLDSHYALDNYSDDDCSICQHLVKSPHKFIPETDPEIIFAEKSVFIFFTFESQIVTNQFEPFMARPPPCMYAC
ncbi:MAG: hypothetical protein K9M75_11925 [Phycisphaerae bacterium]|nr:hypothetical protein [Phycisphaerae bacterium]